MHKDATGPKLHHLLPPAPADSSVPALFDFRALSAVLIPPPPLCNIPCNILTPRVRPYHDAAHRILSHPVCIESESYPRNAFTFNCGLVVPAAADFSSYLPVVKKLATLFRGWEEQGRFLSGDLGGQSHVTASSGLRRDFEDDDELDDDDDDDDNDSNGEAEPAHPTTSRIYAILEILLEDLNSYGETQIPLPPPFADTLNLKLFPTYAPPPPLHPWQVPLLTVPPTALLDTPEMDLTMARVLPHVDGVNSVARISLLADADLKLVRKAIRHLLFYGCCLLLDIFAFGAIYAPTESVATFVEDEAMQEECLAYCRLPSSSHSQPQPPPPSAAAGGAPVQTPSGTGASAGGGGGTGDTATATTTTSHPKPPPLLTKDFLIELYTSLSQGLTLRAWCAEWASSPAAPVSSSSPSRPPVGSATTTTTPSSNPPPTSSSRTPRSTGVNPADILDLRRFITFGVIRGFLYRVHRYAILVSPAGVGLTAGAATAARSSRRRKTAAGAGGVSAAVAAAATATATATTAATSRREPGGKKTRDGATADKDRHATPATPAVAAANANEDDDHDRQRLRPFLDGTHCFDEICTALGISERELMIRLKGFGSSSGGGGGGGEVVILCR